MPLPEGFDWNQPAPGYEKAWGGMRPGDKQSTWEYIMAQEGRQEADSEQAMQSLMSAQPQRQMMGPGQGRGPMDGSGGGRGMGGGLMDTQAPPTPAGMGIGSGQKPGSLLDLLMRK